MPIRQDLYIALVLAALGAGAGEPARAEAPTPALDQLIAFHQLSDADRDAVGVLLRRAQKLQRQGEAGEAAALLAEIVAIFRAA